MLAKRKNIYYRLQMIQPSFYILDEERVPVYLRSYQQQNRIQVEGFACNMADLGLTISPY